MAAAYVMQCYLAGAASEPPPLRPYLLLGAGALPLWHFLLRQRGLYRPRRGQSRLMEARLLIEVSTLATLIVAATTFFSGTPGVSRFTLVVFWALATGGLVVLRATIRATLAELRRRGLNQRNVVIVGTGATGRAVWERLQADSDAGFTVVGCVDESRLGRATGAPPVIGGIADLGRIVAERRIDQVVVALDRTGPIDATKVLGELEKTTASVWLVPDLQGLPTLHSGIEDFDGIPVIRLIESPLLGWNQLCKRTFDLLVAPALLVGLAPLFLALALAIRWRSPGGPVLYRQERVGLDGRVFRIIKFRTMKPGAEEETGPRWAQRDDPRCTPIGRVLRRLNLDELPQLWNVVRGDMSLVGPRPERPEFVQRFRDHVPGYMLRHKVKAGMTGWAQVRGWRGDTSIEKRLECDLEYVRRWSLKLDLKILFLTLSRSFRDPNAY